MVNSILVTGKNGQLGQSLHKISKNYPQYDYIFVGREELNFCQSQSINRYFKNQHFDVIINCAAYTAVDKAESEAVLADQINNQAVAQLAQIAKNQNAMMIHISTDYVFNGQNYKPYTETDLTDPQNVYGLTKLKGEQAIQKIDSNAVILRTSWVYSEFGFNFVKTMLRLGKERKALNIIYDQVGTPTYAGDLAQAIMDVIAFRLSHDRHSGLTEKFIKENVSVYHYSNEGSCSWYDFAKEIFEFNNISCQVTPIETNKYPSPAKRPSYSILNKAKIKNDTGIKIPFWQDSLVLCLKILETNSTNTD